MENIENLGKMELNGKKFVLIPESDFFNMKKQLAKCKCYILKSDDSEDFDYDINELEAIKKDMLQNENYITAEGMEELFNSAYPIKAFREFNNMSQEELAERADVTTDYIRKLEKKERKGSVDVLNKIANILEVDISRLTK